MNLKRTVFSFAAASIFALGLGASAMAQTSTGNVIQEIVPAAESSDTLNAWLEEGSMDEFRFSNESGSSKGGMTLGVKDGRGNNAGWTVTLQATDFKRGEDDQNITGLNANPISAEGFKIVENKGIEGIPGKTEGIRADGSSSGLKAEQIVLTADIGAGTGVYHQTYGTELVIPAQQAPGTYTAVVTVGIASGPGN